MIADSTLVAPKLGRVLFRPAKIGETLPAGTSFGFTVADGDVLRLQQLLAQLNFLPVSFTATAPAPAPIRVSPNDIR